LARHDQRHRRREERLGGKTLLIIGLGRIGGRLARLAKAFDLRVLGIRRDPAAGRNGADEVAGSTACRAAARGAISSPSPCPLTPETEGVIGSAALKLMKRSALPDQCRPRSLRRGER
jgi:phosphoglycerate dehydrogenase-like enzyme